MELNVIVEMGLTMFLAFIHHRLSSCIKDVPRHTCDTALKMKSTLHVTRLKELLNIDRKRTVKNYQCSDQDSGCLNSQ